MMHALKSDHVQIQAHHEVLFDAVMRQLMEAIGQCRELPRLHTPASADIHAMLLRMSKNRSSFLSRALPQCMWLHLVRQVDMVTSLPWQQRVAASSWPTALGDFVLRAREDNSNNDDDNNAVAADVAMEHPTSQHIAAAPSCVSVPLVASPYAGEATHTLLVRAQNKAQRRARVKWWKRACNALTQQQRQQGVPVANPIAVLPKAATQEVVVHDVQQWSEWLHQAPHARCDGPVTFGGHAPSGGHPQNGGVCEMSV